jgi:DNA-binding beta-propeller fold protein YncE
MRYLLLALAACVFVLAGCAAPQKAAEAPVFYPPPPELPRIQFLVSYRSVKDIGGGTSAFDVFVTGTEDVRRLTKPYGLAIYEGKIYVCDTGGSVMVFDLEKKTFERLKGAEGQGKLLTPINIRIDKDGTKYVADSGRKQVIVFDRNDMYLTSYGIEGKWRPVDAVPFGDRVYVADTENGDIKVFDKASGKLIKKIGTGGVLDRPTNIAFDDEGYLYVSDAAKFQVVELDRDGHERGTIGKLGLNFGHFARPKGVALDRSGRIFVVDASFYNVQIFSVKRQQLLTFFGEGGTKPGKLILPAQVVVDYDNLKYFEQYVAPNFSPEFLVLVTSQFGDRMVNVFAFGKEKGKKYPTDEEMDAELKRG